jgi:hypothetical protein
MASATASGNDLVPAGGAARFAAAIWSMTGYWGGSSPVRSLHARARIHQVLHETLGALDLIPE